MLGKIKRAVFAAQTRIIVCAGLGTVSIVDSFKRVYSVREQVLSVDPIEFAVGVVFLLIAWLIYKKWSTNLKK